MATNENGLMHVGNKSKLNIYGLTPYGQEKEKLQCKIIYHAQFESQNCVSANYVLQALTNSFPLRSIDGGT